ncbi:MAG: hypothetical protein J6X84_01195 [Treponema sp.]|nr:hypothetical protein [Treponema sp.]
MHVIDWILLAIVLITIGILIFACASKKNILKKVSECLVIPLFAILNITLLVQSLPDSRHILRISTLVLLLISVSTICMTYSSKRLLRILARLLIFASVFCWISLYRTIFYIHKVPFWLIILMILVYIVTIVFACIISGKQEGIYYFIFAIGFAPYAYLNFCTVIFLCFERTISSIILFAGSVIFLLLNSFQFINQARLKFKHADVIRYILLITSQILIASSNILMIR